MKILPAILILFLIPGIIFAQEDFKLPKDSDYPKLPKYGRAIKDFIPPHWTILAKAFGDLNADGAQDCVLAIRGNDPQFLNENNSLGPKIFDTNPRILVILFGDKLHHRYKIAEQSNSFIISANSPSVDEPFDGVSIKRGILQLDFNIFMSAGGWGATNSYYRFKYLKGEFCLIGADRDDRQRNTAAEEGRSYDFLTNKVSISIGNFAEDTKPKVRWKIYKVGKLKTFRTFAAPYSWEIEPNYFL